MRSLIASNRALEKVVDFSHLQVFDGPTTYTCLLFLSREPRNTIQYLKVGEETRLESVEGVESSVPAKNLSSEPWIFASRAERTILEKTAKGGVPLLSIPTAISRGSSSGADEVFIVRRTERAGLYTARDGESVRLEAQILRTPLYATDFGRYLFGPQNDERIIFPYRIDGDSSSLISEKEFKSRFPRAFEYLRRRRKQLEARKQFVEWYGYSASRNLPLHETAHILVPLLADRGLFSEFPRGQNRFCLMASGGFSIKLGTDVQLSPRYLLGILNSKLLFSYLRSTSNIFRGGWITCTKQYVGPLSIRLIDFSDPADKARHDRMVELVERMLEFNKRRGGLGPPVAGKRTGAQRAPLPAAGEGRAVAAIYDRRPDERSSPLQGEVLDREIASTDRAIDELVYELYGITDEERKIIEQT